MTYPRPPALRLRPRTYRTGLEVATRGIGLAAGVVYSVGAILNAVLSILRGIGLSRIMLHASVLIVSGVMTLLFAILIMAMSVMLMSQLPRPALVAAAAVFFSIPHFLLSVLLIVDGELGTAIAVIIGAALLIAGVPTYVLSSSPVAGIVGASLGLTGIAMIYFAFWIRISEELALVLAALGGTPIIEVISIIIGAVAAILYAIPSLRDMPKRIVVDIMASVALMLFAIGLMHGNASLLQFCLRYHSYLAMQEIPVPIVIARAAVLLTAGVLLLVASILLLVFSARQTISAMRAPPSAPTPPPASLTKPAA